MAPRVGLALTFAPTFALAFALVGCSRPTPTPAPHEQAKTPPTAQSPPQSPHEPDLPAPSQPPPCTADGARGPPWTALNAYLARAPMPAGFTCPARFDLVQTRPWSRDSLAETPANLGDIYEFVGRDPSSGDVLLATIGRLDTVPERDPGATQRELDARAYFNLVPEEPSLPLGLAGPGLEPVRWYGQRFAARPLAAVTDPLRWLGEHPIEALDIVRMTSAEGAELDDVWLVHHRAGATVTICARAEALRCWTRAGIRDSSLKREGELGVDLEIVPRRGAAEAWRIDAHVALRPGEDTASATSPWTETDTLPEGVAELSAFDRVRTLGPGIIAIGRYTTIGHATKHRAPITSWILREADGAWSPIATPDLVLRELIPLPHALALVEARQLISAGGSEDSLRLLAFAPTGDAWRLLGQLPPELGEIVSSPLGEYAWQRSIEVIGDDCLRLGAGSHSGVTFDLETDAETSIDARVRAHLAATNGRWSVGEGGLRPRCPAR